MPQLKGIGMWLNIYCDTFVEQVTWAYIIQKNQNCNWLGMQMQDVFQIPIELDLKHDMYLLMVVQQYLGDQSSKQW